MLMFHLILYKNRYLLKEAGINGGNRIIEKYEMHKVALEAINIICEKDIKLYKNDIYNNNDLFCFFKNNPIVKMLINLKLLTSKNLFHRVINKILRVILGFKIRNNY